MEVAVTTADVQSSSQIIIINKTTPNIPQTFHRSSTAVFQPCLSLSLSLHFNGHSPGEPGLAGVYWSKGWWKWWWQLGLQVVQRSNQIITTNKPTPSLFLQAGCHSCRTTNSVKALNGNLSTLSLTTKSFWLCYGGGLPSLLSVFWHQYLHQKFAECKRQKTAKAWHLT